MRALIAIALVGCHTSLPEVAPDAPAIDAADATPITPETVRVTRIIDGVPIEHAIVLFVDANDQLVAQTETDASGHATAAVPAGVSMTIVHPPLPNRGQALITILDVQPGDDLDIIDQPNDVRGTPIGNVSVSFAPFPNAVMYYLDAGCAGTDYVTASPFTIGLLTTCASTSGTYDLMAYAFDQNYETIAFAPLRDLTSVSSKTLPAWRTDFVHRDVALTNAPDHATGTRVTVSFDRGGVRYGGFTSNAAPAVFDIPDYAPDHDITWTQLWFDGRVDHRGSSLLAVEPVATARTIDLSTLLPRIGSTSASVVDGAVEVAWTSDAPIDHADGATFSLIWGNTPNVGAIWYVVAPPTATSPYRLPVLPSPARHPDDGATFRTAVRFYDLDFVDWNGFRAGWSVLPYPATYRSRQTYSVDP